MYSQQTNKVLNVQESDTTEVEKRTKAHYIKNKFHKINLQQWLKMNMTQSW